MGSLYTHIKSYQAAFYAYKINLFSTISSLASGHITPQFLLPQEIADIVQELSDDEVRRGTKLSPAIQPGYEAIYYEINIVLEVTLIPRGISVVLGIPMNSKSSTFDVYHAIPCINRMGTTRQHLCTSFKSPFWQFLRTTPVLRNSKVPHYNSAQGIIGSNSVARVSLLRQTKHFFV